MIGVVRSELDARERYRWMVALGQRPILAERTPRARGPQLVAGASAFVYLVMLVVILTNTMMGEGTLGALAAAAILLAGRYAITRWVEARSRWPSGRYLFSWGYVEVEHDALRYLAAAELAHEIGEDAVTLRAGTWSATLPAAIDPPLREALARLGAPQPAPAPGGYRDGPWLVTGTRVRPPLLSPRARELAWVVCVTCFALVGAALGHAARRMRAEAPSAPRSDFNLVAPTARSPATRAARALHE